MNEKTKESKFLDAINKYAEYQKAQITQEIEDYKNTKIEQATEQGLQDAYELIRDDIAKRKAAIVNTVSKEELKLRNELFRERQTIFDDVFRQAKDRLTAFTKTEAYQDFLSRSVKKITETCKAEPCTVYIASADEEKRDWLSSQLPNAQIVTDPHILLGGIRAHCVTMGIMMDDTLDTRLNDQRTWFIENSGLKVV